MELDLNLGEICMKILHRNLHNPIYRLVYSMGLFMTLQNSYQSDLNLYKNVTVTRERKKGTNICSFESISILVLQNLQYFYTCSFLQPYHLDGLYGWGRAKDISCPVNKIYSTLLNS